MSTLKQGYLEKQGRVNSSNWKKRYFVIFDGILHRYNKPPSSTMRRVSSKGDIDLRGCLVLNKSNVRDFCFAIVEPNGNENLLVAGSAQEMNEWIAAIKTVASSSHNFGTAMANGKPVIYAVPKTPIAPSSVPVPGQVIPDQKPRTNSAPSIHNPPQPVRHANSFTEPPQHKQAYLNPQYNSLRNSAPGFAPVPSSNSNSFPQQQNYVVPSNYVAPQQPQQNYVAPQQPPQQNYVVSSSQPQPQQNYFAPLPAKQQQSSNHPRSYSTSNLYPNLAPNQPEVTPHPPPGNPPPNYINPPPNKQPISPPNYPQHSPNVPMKVTNRPPPQNNYVPPPNPSFNPPPSYNPNYINPPNNQPNYQTDFFQSPQTNYVTPQLPPPTQNYVAPQLPPQNNYVAPQSPPQNNYVAPQSPQNFQPTNYNVIPNSNFGNSTSPNSAPNTPIQPNKKPLPPAPSYPDVYSYAKNNSFSAVEQKLIEERIKQNRISEEQKLRMQIEEELRLEEEEKKQKRLQQEKIEAEKRRLAEIERRKKEEEMKIRKELEMQYQQQLQIKLQEAEGQLRREIEEKVRVEHEFRMQEIERKSKEEEMLLAQQEEMLLKEQLELFHLSEAQEAVQKAKEEELRKKQEEDRIRREVQIEYEQKERQKAAKWIEKNPQWKAFYLQLGMKEQELQDYHTLEELVDMTLQFILSSNKMSEFPGIETVRDPPLNPEVIPIAPKAPATYVKNTGNGKTIAEELKEFKFKATTVEVTPKDFTENQQRDLQDLLKNVMHKMRSKVGDEHSVTNGNQVLYWN